ncbi:MAG: outer membrane beta-barrel protein [Bacteroidota bacterium]|nr:outer membrane beta-barrel protein [Bacteroidota bacterium]
MKKILLTTGIVLFSLLLFSQSSTTSSRIGRNYNSNGWSMQLAFGPNIAFTDIKQYDYYPVTNYNNEWRFATSLTIQRDFGDIFSLRGQLLYGKLAGTKRVTNRYFEADLFDYSLQTTINFNNLFRSTNQNSPLNIYGIAGIGLSNWKTKLKNLNDDNIIGGNGSANVGMLKMTTEAFIPLGVGISYRISDKIDLNAESTMRITNSDLLDATDSGSKFDMYSYTSLGITYKLGKRNYRKTTTRRKDATPQKHTIDIQKKEIKIKKNKNRLYKNFIKKA